MNLTELKNLSGAQNSGFVPSRVTPRGTDQRPFPDVILKSQFFDVIGKRSLTSEQRLMLAVLADAINIVQDCHSSQTAGKRTTFTEAWNWIFAKGISCPLSFENVADALGIDPEKWV